MELRLDLGIVDVLADRLRFPLPVIPYDIPYTGRTPDERGEHLVDGLRWLKKHNLATDSGIDPEVEELVLTWAKPEVLITMSAIETATDTVYQYRSGWSGRYGFHSYLDGDAVVIQDGRPSQVPYALLEMFPAVAALDANPAVAHGHPGDDGDEDDLGIADVDPRMGGLKPDEGNLRVYFDAGQKLVRGGTVNLSTRDGKKLESLESMKWVDTEQGRFVILTETTSDGATRVSFTPTDGDLIRWWITDRLPIDD